MIRSRRALRAMAVRIETVKDSMTTAGAHSTKRVSTTM
jgi:hypothetical protein